MYNNRKREMDNGLYRKIEAMYYGNYSITEIASSCGITKTKALDVTQLIFGRKMKMK